MSLEVTVSHTFDAAHRIPILSGPGAKCRNVHGHTFAVQWTFSTDGYDLESVEFGAIKASLRGWVDEFMDHGYVCGPDDEIGSYLAVQGCKVMVLPGWPTTEAMAGYLAAVASELLPDLTLTRVHLHEGSSNAATWTHGSPRLEELNPDMQLTRDQVAARTGYSRQTLAHMACEGRGPAYGRRGRRVVYRLGDVIAWQKQQEQELAATAATQVMPK